MYINNKYVLKSSKYLLLKKKDVFYSKMKYKNIIIYPIILNAIYNNMHFKILKFKITQILS